ncbi:MAG: hypothetical protein AABX97_05685, partial [Candidatus Thermoplasmatota archaeon]
MAGFPEAGRREAPQHNLYAAHYVVMGLTGAFSMATEFELSVRGTRKVLANSAAVSEEQAVKPSTVATARVDDKYAVEFRTGKGGECRGSVMEFDIAPNA